jgi:phosphoglycerate dehydrogenase-like enzyme
MIEEECAHAVVEYAVMRRLAIYLPHPLPIWRLPEGYVEKIRRAAGKRFELDLPVNEAGLVKSLPEVEVLYAWGLAQRLVSQAAKLHWIHTPLTGVDRLLNPDLRATEIRVTCSRGVNSVAVAEHTFAMVMALTRGIAEAVQAQAHRRWRQTELYGRKPPLIELRGKTLGIYGVGEIGRELATRAQAFGMKVWAVARTTKTAPFGVDKLLPMTRAETMVRMADVLVLALPLTPATQGLFGERLLRRMKSSAILVNIGRGALIQEPALVRALREGWIGGACLDVFGTEPLSPTNPLWGMPNVLLTPHVAGLHPDYMARSADIFLDNLKRYVGGKPLLNEVDLQAGY